MKALDVLNPNPRSTLSGRLIFQLIFRSKNVIFPSKTKLQNWVEIKFQRNIWGQLDVRTRMRASKSWNFDLEKPIKPIKMDSCVIFADHCRADVRYLFGMYRKHLFDARHSGETRSDLGT